MANNYAIYFTRDTQVVRLPVNPATLPVDRSTSNEDYNVLGIGPIMVPRTPDLRVVSISGYFPAYPVPWMLDKPRFEPPEFYMQFFEAAMQDKVPITYTPVRYTEMGEPFMTADGGFEVLVTQFKTEERAGETGDLYYDLEITEYRDYSPVNLTVQAQSAAADSTKLTAAASRQIPAGQLYAGCNAIANGSAYLDEYGLPPGAPLAGQLVTVRRIIADKYAYPCYITDNAGNGIGWVKKSALQAVSQK